MGYTPSSGSDAHAASNIRATTTTDVPTPNMLPTVNLWTSLEADPRPTVVVDLAAVLESKYLQFVYLNPAVTENKDLRLCMQSSHQHHDDFAKWCTSVDDPERYFRYGGIEWMGFVVHARWKVISASPSIASPTGHRSRKRPRHAVDQSTKSWGSKPDALAGDEDHAHQAAIEHLKDEIQTLELGKKLASEERSMCVETVRKLKAQLERFQDPALAAGMISLEPDARDASAEHAQHDHGPDRTSSSGSDRDPIRPPGDNVALSTSEESAWRMPTRQSRLPVPRPSKSHEGILDLEKFKQLAEMVDVGFFDYDCTGRLRYANESWYALSGHPREPEKHTHLTFMQCVYPADEQLVLQHWGKLLEGTPVTFEMRWNKKRQDSNDPILASDAQWVLSACVPVIGSDGKVKSISGCTTDINFQKHAAAVALQRASALERVRASEERFARFASVAPIAIFRFDQNKNMEYCNDRWFEMTGLPKVPFDEIEYPFGVFADDIDRCNAAWDAARGDNSIGTVEFRLRTEWRDTNGRRGQTWAYCTFFPEYADDGSFQGLMGSLLDISHLKWAENMQKLRAEEALEAKRQQEAFIDVTSHEMRNPLSAMVQCADSIITSLSDLVPKDNVTVGRAQWTERLESSLDAAQTILSCAAHQKRIVDDILTLSKLDSNLLLITPVKTQPVQMIRDLVKMFDMDCAKADVRLESVIDSSFQDLQVDWLTLDPSRVLQILINLLTNAIKFTRDAEIRNVTVRASVSHEPPSKTRMGMTYIPAETVTDDYACGGDWGSGESVYLEFEVSDTGRGLNDEEKAKLFLRFSQASPKTHVEYGGSGLGLFISRKLTEMQGGEIGFASVPNLGSTFVFYVKTRRTDGPVKEKALFSQPVARWSFKAGANGVRQEYNVLLVEDNIVNQRVLKQQLVRLGCNVFLANHGGESLAFLESTRSWIKSASVPPTGVVDSAVRLDVILMDIEMPVMGGLECTRSIRSMEAQGVLRGHMPIISISANARSEQVGQATLAGVDDTITKPFRIAELMPKIQSLVP